MVFILLLIILLSSTCFSRDGALTGERHQTLQTKIIYATHYSGTIHTLALTHHENGTYSLTETSVVRSRVLRPSWITFDRIERVLYCSDEFGGILPLSLFLFLIMLQLILTMYAVYSGGLRFKHSRRSDRLLRLAGWKII